MAKKNIKTVFSCQSCGYQTPKWLGKCPDCGQWHSFTEETVTPRVTKRAEETTLSGTGTPVPVPIDAITIENEQRLSTGIGEFDRVLGGGVVPGTLVLIGGDPGIGKSTLMLQALYGLAQIGHKVLYVSGEESIRQIKLRSQRLNTQAPQLFVVSEIDIDVILTMIKSFDPALIVIDSIQTMFHPSLSSAPGSISQVRETTLKLMLMAKRTGIPVFLVGHVTKDGAIAGPRLLEHMVDTVLYFEGDRSHIFRILRAVKNRFGSTNEIGVFEMNRNGLEEISNPSALFLSERPDNAPGSVVTACMEGTRPVLVEIQALASSTHLGTPRRTILGLDANRVALLVAVLEKKVGFQLMGHDLFMNVAGGAKVVEPAVDIGIICAVASSFMDKPVPEGTVVLGEVGLTGEVRAIGQIENRVSECEKMGFTRCLLPESNLARCKEIQGIRILGIKTVSDAIEALF